MALMGRAEAIIGGTAVVLAVVAALAGAGWVAWTAAHAPPAGPNRVQPVALPALPAAEQFPSGVNGAVVEDLRPKLAQCQAAVARMLATGFYKHETPSDGAVSVQVDEAAWNAIDYDDKIRQGLLIYCARMPLSGIFQVYLEGSRTGRRLGGVINGSWAP